MASSYALYVAVSFHGEVVEEQSVRFGESVQLGNSAAVAVPVPQGHDHVARVVWTGPRTAVVETATGGLHEVTPGEDLTIEVGPVALRLYLVEQFRIQRARPWSGIAALAWFTIVILTSLLFVQIEWINRFPNYCLVSDHLLRDYKYELAFYQRDCMQPEDDGGESAAFTAEYIARLLKKDFEGSEQGLIETVENMDRPDAELQIEEEDPHIFLPAGNEGPKDTMGGAEDVAPEPVRGVDNDEIVVPKKRIEPELELALEDSNVVDDPVEIQDPEDGEDEGLEDAEESDRQNLELPAEEEEGWGIPDWYDEEDATLEQLIVKYQLQRVKERLAIDPEDPVALSLLSYYQYLAQDYDGATETYDKIIEQFPEQSNGYNNKALIYKRRAEYQKEEALYRIALSIEPGDDIVMNNLAVNLAHQGRFDEALAIMSQLEEIVPGDAYANLHRSKIYAEMGDDEQAYFYLREALKGFETMDTLHRIEFRQDIRLDPSFATLREQRRFRSILAEFFGKDVPLPPE
ncbi:MAG: tetratricopeptide repeat protein [Myxococcota bacterium]